MTLKSLIQRLLDSRTTPAQAAHNAAPGTGDIGIAGTEYICPSDGYVTALSNGASAGGFNITLKRNGLNVQGGPQEIQFAEWTQARMIPVAKGDKVTLELYNQNIWEWRFIPAIGGGYKLLVRRTLSCLRALSLFSPRSSFRTNPNGLATKQCLTIQQSGLSTRLKAHRANTLLRVTGMSLFTLVAMNGRKSGMETEVSLSPQRVLPTSAFKCLSLKAPKLGMSFRTPWPTELKKRPLSLFQQSERDALTGGALC